jgi:hypothetical protein
MARIITFLPKQTITGNDIEIYSEVFDVTEYPRISANFKVDSFWGVGSISAILQDTMEPSLEPAEFWRDVVSAGKNSAPSEAVLTGGGLLRFIRLKLTAGPGISGAVVSVEGRALEKS